jgi:serine/threonine-protein kinase
MADAYYQLGLLMHLPINEAYLEARTCAQKAIEIDPNDADAHAVLATVRLNFDWDWEGAESAFKRAIELNPNNVRSRAQYAFHLACLGRMNEALEQMTRALSLDPLLDPLNLGFVLLRMGRLGEARKQFQKSLDLEPDRAHSLWFLGHIDVLLGRHEEGLAEIRRALSLSGNNVIILAGYGWSNAVAGKRSEAMKVIEELRERSLTEPIPSFCSAKIYSALGESDLAFEWLEKAYKEHDTSMATILTDESLKGLHQDPRFAKMLRKMKLKHPS